MSQKLVLAAIERGRNKPEEIAKATRIPLDQVHTHLHRLKDKSIVRRDGDKWVMASSGLALLDHWK